MGHLVTCQTKDEEEEPKEKLFIITFRHLFKIDPKKRRKMRVTTIEATDSGRCFTVFENHCKKSHFSTLRAKRATFIFFKHLNFRAKVVNIQKNWFECKIISWMDSSYEGLHWWTHRCFQHQKLPFLARKFKVRLFWWFSNTVCFPIFNASTSFSSFFFHRKVDSNTYVLSILLHLLFS